MAVAIATLAGIVDWVAIKTSLETALTTRPTFYKTAAAGVLTNILAKGQSYDAAIGQTRNKDLVVVSSPDRVITLAAWQASLSANRTALDDALLPLYQAAIQAWKSNGTYANPANPDGVTLPTTLDELPIAQAGKTLLDASAHPSVLLKAREPGLWGNQVSVRIVGNTLEARFGGATVVTSPVPLVGAEWRFTTPPAAAWPDHEGIGALLEQPTWAPGATLVPATVAFTSLTGGAGLILSRLLGEVIRFHRPPGGSAASDPQPDRALAREFFRTVIQLVNVGGLLRPVPAALPDTLETHGTIASLWSADADVREAQEQVQRFIAALP
jgi:hypothetical protein